MGDAYPSLSLSMAPSGFVVGPATKPGHGTAGCSTVSGHAAPGCAVLVESPELTFPRRGSTRQATCRPSRPSASAASAPG